MNKICKSQQVILICLYLCFMQGIFYVTAFQLHSFDVYNPTSQYNGIKHLLNQQSHRNLILHSHVCDEKKKPMRNSFGNMKGSRWLDNTTFDTPLISIKQRNIFNHLGDYDSKDDSTDDLRKRNFNLNVGRAMEGLRKELPIVFIATDLDFSIFADRITVVDEGQRHLEISKQVYMTAVKSLRIASSFSSMYPSMNIQKIEYIESSKSIQCIANVVLPDSIRINDQSAWEGNFYFGLNDEGLINSHVFDRKINTWKPASLNTKGYPWLRPSVQWSPELILSPQCKQLITLE